MAFESKRRVAGQADIGRGIDLGLLAIGGDIGERTL
jgi:hypothetical protein